MSGAESDATWHVPMNGMPVTFSYWAIGSLQIL